MPTTSNRSPLTRILLDRARSHNSRLSANLLAVRDQGLALPVRYDRNAPAKPPHRLCPRHHLRAGPEAGHSLPLDRAGGF